MALTEHSLRFVLIEGLDIVPAAPPHRSGTTVRVVTAQRSPATKGG